MRFRAVNSCIQFVPTLDGKELITVESLKGPEGALHPVQQAMVDCHGSQCGFCTPGFVMSLFALYKTRQAPTRAEIGDALSGNLCRCTGYRPIVDAGVKMYEYGRDREDRHQHWMNCSFSSGTDREVSQSEREMIERLRAIARRDTLVVRHGTATFYAPVTLEDLAALREEHPDARLLAGGTDVGLWVTKQHKDLPTIIYTGDVAELKEIRETETGLEIGAAANLTDAYEALVARYPELSELYRRFASPPIRNAGTLGGNIANGSPIGDSMPALIVMGATLVLRKGKHAREDAARRASISPTRRRRSHRASSSSAFACPIAPPGAHLRTYKISKRFDQDISAVCGAFQLRLDRGRVAEARIAYGGMAATPKRAPRGRARARRARRGAKLRCARRWPRSADDYAPLTDMRARARYRKSVARNLLYKFWLETSGSTTATQVVEFVGLTPGNAHGHASRRRRRRAHSPRQRAPARQRRGALHRRHPGGSRNAARGDRLERARARAHQVDRPREGARGARRGRRR